MTDMAAIETSIVIPSYRRPVELERTIRSSLAQRDVGGVFEIVVVDNDPDASARPVTGRLAAEAPVEIRYVHEPRPGISQARNAGVAAARGEYLAFIDDDEEAEPDWLAHFLSALRDFGADAAVGPVYPRFPSAGEPVGAYARQVYTRDANAPNGTRLLRWNIGNSIFRKATCFVSPEPFDVRLGLSGGEDTVFLRQLTRRGCTMIWVGDAKVWESVPADRLEPRYLLRRAFRGAQTTTFVCTAVRPRELGRAARLMATGCVQVAVYGPSALVLRWLQRDAWLPAMAKAVGGLGKVLWHPRLHLQLYR